MRARGTGPGSGWCSAPRSAGSARSNASTAPGRQGPDRGVVAADPHAGRQHGGRVRGHRPRRTRTGLRHRDSVRVRGDGHRHRDGPAAVRRLRRGDHRRRRSEHDAHDRVVVREDESTVPTPRPGPPVAAVRHGPRRVRHRRRRWGAVTRTSRRRQGQGRQGACADARLRR
ncbi:hypothetical protein H4W33_007289 [Kibdelosporangium phytohabitans]|nr:hypothetical protein [Kibdelosporangium phytohabitans]